MNDERQQRKNHDIVGRFQEHWKRRHRQVDGTFPCKVSVHYRKRNRIVDTDVCIYPDGRVYVSDREWFNSDDHYSLLNPDFQIYRLGKRRRGLRIYGGSLTPPEDKMGGPYMYDIRPTNRTRARRNG